MTCVDDLPFVLGPRMRLRHGQTANYKYQLEPISTVMQLQGFSISKYLLTIAVCGLLVSNVLVDSAVATLADAQLAVA